MKGVGQKGRDMDKVGRWGDRVDREGGGEGGRGKFMRAKVSARKTKVT